MAAKPTSPPPAYFLSLSLENVRSFGAKQTISFAREDGRPAQWTIILGDNGVGKTTVLKSLAGMMRNETADDLGRLHIWRYIDDLWNPLRFEGKSPAEIQAYNTVNIRLTELQSANGADKQIFRVYVRPESNAQAPYRIRRNQLAVGSNLSSSKKSLSKALTCYGYGAGRAIGNLTLRETLSITDNCASLFGDRADLLNPEEWFLQMEYSSLKKDKQAAKSLEQVKQVLLKVLPDVINIRISSKGHQQYLELETPYGWVRLRDMSLGYQTLVVWLTDFASKLFIRYPDSPNPLEEPAIVLIDEIDLHLHPSWQRKLIGFLSDIFKNTQFIATAHSPLVVQAAGDEGANVVLLRREGDQTVVVQDLPDVRRWRVEQILNSELFDDTSPLSPQTESDLTRRNELLLKKRLTKAEKA